jgi:hypothetical protein
MNFSVEKLDKDNSYALPSNIKMRNSKSLV